MASDGLPCVPCLARQRSQPTTAKTDEQQHTEDEVDDHEPLRGAAQGRPRLLEDGQAAEDREPRAEDGGRERPGLRGGDGLPAPAAPAQGAEHEDDRHREDRQVDDQAVDLWQSRHGRDSPGENVSRR